MKEKDDDLNLEDSESVIYLDTVKHFSYRAVKISYASKRFY